MATVTFGAADGNWSDGTKWSGGSKPTAADDVVFDASSASCTIDEIAYCRSIDTSNFSTVGKVLTHNGFALNVGDGTAGAGNKALHFTNRASSYNATTAAAVINFISTSATVQTVNFNGKTTNNVTFNATSGGSWQYTGAHNTSATATVTLTKGTLDINGQTCSWGLFNSDNSNTRALTLGASSITCTGTGNAWSINTNTGMTLSANNAGCTITLSGAAANFLAGNGFTYNDVVFTGSGALYFSGTTNFRNVTRTGTAAKTDTFSIGGAPTISGTFTCNGNSSINRVQVLSSTVGTARTITAATVSCSNTDFQDITGAGAGSWDFSAQTDIGDCGGNSGITFPASVAQYYGGVNLNGSYLRCNGIASNYVSAPHSTPLALTGDITVDAKVAFDDWTPSTVQCIVAKWVAGSNHRNFEFYLNTDGYLYLGYSVDGSASVFKSSGAVTGVTDGATKWVRFVQDVDDGAGNNLVKFYLSDDGSSWTQLGSTSTTAGAITRYDATSAKLEVGSTGNGASIGATAKVYNVRIYSDITQTTKVFDADFTAQAAGTKSFTESSANAATVSLVVTGGNWSASSWTTRVPLPQDDCYLGNAFAASQTVTADMPRLGRSIDWTGATGSPTWARSTAQSIFGGLVLISGMTLSGTTTFTFAGRSSFSITSAGKTTTNQIQINAPSGTYTLADALIIDRDLTSAFVLNNGTFTDGGYSVTLTGASGTVTIATGTLNATGTWSIGATTAVSYFLVSGGTVNASISTIVLTSASSSTRTFGGGGKTFGTLTYNVAGSTGKLTITGSNSFAAINFSDASNARTLEFTAGTTTTIRNGNGFNVQGTSGKLMTVNSATAATHTLSSPNKQVCSYLNVDYSVATGGGAWYAQSTSTDGGHNTGWIFTDAPAVTTGSSASSRNLQNLQNITNL